MADFSTDRRKVELAPHDPKWAVQAAAESGRLAQAIGPTLIRIEHVGSTSIPGIRAKPTIDLQPIVRCVADLDARQPQVEALGYVWRGEFGIPGRRYCVREKDGRRLFHVHCHQDGHPEIARTLVFRDYLRAHAEEARAYEMLKIACAAAHPDDSHAYSKSKGDWIRACITRAEAWAAAR
ncbi:MAG TPA: GrpB family protein [Hyphomonadaceae bacterium]|nr:GrpB family protein [Hyphomonadaceae bacterium]